MMMKILYLPLFLQLVLCSIHLVEDSQYRTVKKIVSKSGKRCRNGVAGGSNKMKYILKPKLFETSIICEVIQSYSGSTLFIRTQCKGINTFMLTLARQQYSEQQPAYNIGSQYKKVSFQQQQSNNFKLSNCSCQLTINKSSQQYVSLNRLNGDQLITIGNIRVQQKSVSKFSLVDNSTKWGLGQRFQEQFRITDGLWTIWNKDQPFKIDRGHDSTQLQTYGHYPVYLARNSINGLFHIVYLKSTHAIRVKVTNDAYHLDYQLAGGNVDLIIFQGERDPQALLKRFHKWIGQFHLPPFWAMGWHQSRWGYKTLQHLDQVLEGYSTFKLPIDIIWIDLDYMHNKVVFTVDQDSFPPQKVKRLLDIYQVRLIPLIDVAIAVNDKKGIKMGQNMNIFLKKPNGQTFIGSVWPGPSVFIDFLHPNASIFWSIQLDRLWTRMPFDGLWLDMNEPANFNWSVFNTKDDHLLKTSEPLTTMTIDCDLIHFRLKQQDSLIEQSLQHREVHAYYGHLVSTLTYDYLQKYNRPFILTRSGSLGTGLFAAHWTGDNQASWAFLRLSISGNFLFQIYGIPIVGADICGFYRDSTEQLCSRWMQLGCLYPFARNHNHLSSRPQQPYSMGSILIDTSYWALNTRYSILKHLYTYLVGLQQTGGTFFRALFFEFPDDVVTYDNQVSETQFIMGRDLMSAPILRSGEHSREVYFPKDTKWLRIWIDGETGHVGVGAGPRNRGNHNNHQQRQQQETQRQTDQSIYYEQYQEELEPIWPVKQQQSQINYLQSDTQSILTPNILSNNQPLTLASMTLYLTALGVPVSLQQITQFIDDIKRTEMSPSEAIRQFIKEYQYALKYKGVVEGDNQGVDEGDNQKESLMKQFVEQAMQKDKPSIGNQDQISIGDVYITQSKPSKPITPQFHQNSSPKSQLIFQQGYHLVTNPLPSPPILFLRQGHLLFTTKSAQRTANLTNQFRITALITDCDSEQLQQQLRDQQLIAEQHNKSIGRATGRILLLNDYQKQSELTECIEGHCDLQLTIEIVRSSRTITNVTPQKTNSNSNNFNCHDKSQLACLQSKSSLISTLQSQFTAILSLTIHGSFHQTYPLPSITILSIELWKATKNNNNSSNIEPILYQYQEDPIHIAAKRQGKQNWTEDNRVIMLIINEIAIGSLEM